MLFITAWELWFSLKLTHASHLSSCQAPWSPRLCLLAFGPWFPVADLRWSPRVLPPSLPHPQGFCSNSPQIPPWLGMGVCLGGPAFLALTHSPPDPASGGVPTDRVRARGDTPDSDRGEGHHHATAGPGGGQPCPLPAAQPWQQPHHPGHHGRPADPQLPQAGNWMLSGPAWVLGAWRTCRL